MSWTRGTGRYDYTLSIDIEGIMNKILEKLVESKLAVEGRDGKPSADWEFDGTDLIINGTGKCEWKNWYCRATLEDPEENETHMSDTIEEHEFEVSEIIKKVLDEVTVEDIYKLLRTCIDEESLDGDIYEPDPDMMPGGHDYDRGD